jgi:hypothetical protein
MTLFKITFLWLVLSTFTIFFCANSDYLNEKHTCYLDGVISEKYRDLSESGNPTYRLLIKNSETLEEHNTDVKYWNEHQKGDKIHFKHISSTWKNWLAFFAGIFIFNVVILIIWLCFGVSEGLFTEFYEDLTL